MKLICGMVGGAVATLLLGHSVAATSFYVAPDGNDAWSGKLSSGNGLRTDGPLASLPAARDAVRRLKAKAPLAEPVRVVIAQGRYTLAETLTFTADDGGTEKCPVVYQAAPGAQPVLSGGRVITGWKDQGAGIWTAPCPMANIRQLYVDGKRAIRASCPVPAGLELFGDSGYRTRDFTVLRWRNVADIEFCYLVTWAHSRCKVASVQQDSADKTRAVITMQQPTFAIARTKEGVQVALPSCIEHVFEGLTQPGTWYLGRPTPMNYNNRAQNRIATCKEQDNFFAPAPTASEKAKPIAEQAGLEPAYRDVLK